MNPEWGTNSRPDAAGGEAGVARPDGRPPNSPADALLFSLQIVLVGLGGALAVWIFEHALAGLETALLGLDTSLVAAARSLPPWRRALTPTAGAVAAGLLLYVFQKRRRAGRRPPTDYIEAFTVGDGRLDAAGSLISCLASLLVVSCGLAVGREGAMILLAALLGSWAARLRPAEPAEATVERRRTLVACGAAAGMAAAYHAPIAGAFFAAEVLAGGSLSLRVLGPVTLAAFCSRLGTGLVSNFSPLYAVPVVPQPEISLYAALAVFSLLCGVCGTMFLAALARARELFDRAAVFLRAPLPVRLGIGGLLVGLLSLWYPEVWGNGAGTVRLYLGAPPLAGVAAAVLGAKLCAMLASTGGGAPGGVLTPTLFVGTAFGVLMGHGFAFLPGLDGPMWLFTLCGMAGLLAATTRAPFMSAFMIAESSGAYDLLPALLFVCLPARALAGRLRPLSVYGIPT